MWFTVTLFYFLNHNLLHILAETQEGRSNEGDDFPLNVVKKGPLHCNGDVSKPNLPRQNVSVDQQYGMMAKDLFKMMKRGDGY